MSYKSYANAATGRAKRVASPHVKSSEKAELFSSMRSGRANIPPETGFSLIVDGHRKGLYDTEEAAKGNASALKSRYPFLRIEIFDAVRKVQTRVE